MKLYIALAATIYCIPCNAQGDYDGTVRRILDNNIQLKASSALTTAQTLDHSDSNALPNPEVGFSHLWGDNNAGNKLQLDINQSFEWPGLYAARRRAAISATAAANAETAGMALDLRIKAETLLNELVYVRQQLAATRELEASYAKLSEAMDKGLRGGEITVLDHRKMQIESYKLDNTITTLRMREQQLTSELQALSQVTLDLDGIDAYPPRRLSNPDEYLSNVSKDPEILIQESYASMEEDNARVAAMSRYPAFTVGYQHQTEMGERFNGITLGMTLPFFQHRNARKSALIRKDAAEQSARAISDSKADEVRGLIRELEIARKNITDYDRVFGDNQYLPLLLKAYEGGQIDVIGYISEVRYYMEATQSKLEADYNYNMLLTNLTRYQ